MQGSDNPYAAPAATVAQAVELRVDALMIFGDDKRCLHDKMADTIVVRA